jgi:hypothetical protein
MATPINLGNQKITFDFKGPAKGSEFNRLLYGSVKPGIYKGLELSIVSTSSISISPGIAFLNTSFQAETKRMVLAETRSNISYTFTNTSYNQILYLKYDYKELVDNWVQVASIPASGSAPVNSVIIGNVYFNEGSISSADYKNKTWGLYRADSNQYSINDVITFSDVNDLTKQVRFSASGVSSSSVRIIQIPDYDYSLNTFQDWVSSRNYKKDEIAVYDRVVYRCNFTHTSSNFESQISYWDNVGGGLKYDSTYTLTYNSWTSPNSDLEIPINHALNKFVQVYTYNNSTLEEYFTGVIRIDDNNIKIVINWEIRDVLFPLGVGSPSVVVRILCI